MYGERRAIRSIYSRAENQGEHEGVRGKRKGTEREKEREGGGQHGEGKLAGGKKRM